MAAGKNNETGCLAANRLGDMTCPNPSTSPAMYRPVKPVSKANTMSCSRPIRTRFSKSLFGLHAVLHLRADSQIRPKVAQKTRPRPGQTHNEAKCFRKTSGYVLVEHFGHFGVFHAHERIVVVQRAPLQVGIGIEATSTYTGETTTAIAFEVRLVQRRFAIWGQRPMARRAVSNGLGTTTKDEERRGSNQ
jgi:hypothetical protein